MPSSGSCHGSEGQSQAKLKRGHLFAGENEALLVRRDPLFVIDLDHTREQAIRETSKQTDPNLHLHIENGLVAP